jgi:hypothetical protein
LNSRSPTATLPRNVLSAFRVPGGFIPTQFPPVAGTSESATRDRGSYRFLRRARRIISNKSDVARARIGLPSSDLKRRSRTSSKAAVRPRGRLEQACR